jgi:hypothetical protein
MRVVAQKLIVLVNVSQSSMDAYADFAGTALRFKLTLCWLAYEFTDHWCGACAALVAKPLVCPSVAGVAVARHYGASSEPETLHQAHVPAKPTF